MMMQLEVAGRRHSLAAGEMVIGSDAGCTLVLPGQGVQPRHAAVQTTPQGTAIRAAAPEAEVRVNGIRLGAEPTPVLHGDKIQIGEHELLVVDPARVGGTQLFDSGAFADLVPPQPAKRTPTASTGGRVVCLTDGREYSVGPGLVFGRDASCDVVVTGEDVSRRHAEIRPSAEGYVLRDESINGTFLNGARVSGSQILARADVIRIGHDEFRFYADPVPASSRPVPEGPPTGAEHRLSDTMIGVPLAQLRPPTPPAAVAAPLASFLVRTGSMRGQRLPIRSPVVNIGRGEYNDLVINDPSVSTAHAKLQRREGIWILSDAGSTNGTYVDGDMITGETALGPGASVRLGEVTLLFEPLDDKLGVTPGAETKVTERIEVGPPAMDQFEAAPSRPARPRRPVPVAPPQRPGIPGWAIFALLAAAAAAGAFFVLVR